LVTSSDLMMELSGTVSDLLELRLMATIDPLTGARNRRGFLNEAARALALAMRHRLPLSVIAIDLDHFKSINDTYGHQVGDEVLIQAVHCCSRKIRSTDLIGRMGGEEFAILLPHTAPPEAMAIAEKVRQAIEEQVSVPDLARRVTASLGIASATGTSFNAEQLLANADAALYRAKNAGRNRCVADSRTENAPTAGRRVLKAGKIVFNAGSSIIDCTVRRISDLAASIDLSSTAGVPETFKLRIESDSFSRMCRITEKKDGRLEVQFAA
jgi:diguanylate cyclase (GGDEF)-like protein